MLYKTQDINLFMMMYILFQLGPFVTGFGKTDHNVTFDISRNTD